MGIYSCKLQQYGARGLNTPVSSVVSSVEEVEFFYQEHPVMELVTDVTYLQEKGLAFEIKSGEVLRKNIRKYLKCYFNPRRHMMCVELPKEEIPLLCIFTYTYSENGFITIYIEESTNKALFNGYSGDDPASLVTIYDRGISEHIRKFVQSHVLTRGITGKHNCRMYDSGVGRKLQPIVYWF